MYGSRFVLGHVGFKCQLRPFTMGGPAARVARHILGFACKARGAAHPAARRLPRQETHWRADTRRLDGRVKCSARRHDRQVFGDIADTSSLHGNGFEEAVHALAGGVAHGSTT